MSLRFLRLPAGRQMSTRSTGRTSHMKTNKRSLRGSTSSSPVIWMDHCLPIHPPHPSPRGVQAITHPRRHRHRDPRHHFLLARLVPEQARTRDPTPRTKLPRFRLPQQLDAGLFLPCCRNMDPYVPHSCIGYYRNRSLLRWSCAQPKINYTTKPPAPTEIPPLPNASTRHSHFGDPSSFRSVSSYCFSHLSHYNPIA